MSDNTKRSSHPHIPIKKSNAPDTKLSKTPPSGAPGGPSDRTPGDIRAGRPDRELDKKPPKK